MSKGNSGWLREEMGKIPTFERRVLLALAALVSLLPLLCARPLSQDAQSTETNGKTVSQHLTPEQKYQASNKQLKEEREKDVDGLKEEFCSAEPRIQECQKEMVMKLAAAGLLPCNEVGTNSEKCATTKTRIKDKEIVKFHEAVTQCNQEIVICHTNAINNQWYAAFLLGKCKKSGEGQTVDTEVAGTAACVQWRMVESYQNNTEASSGPAKMKKRRK